MLRQKSIHSSSPIINIENVGFSDIFDLKLFNELLSDLSNLLAAGIIIVDKNGETMIRTPNFGDIAEECALKQEPDKPDVCAIFSQTALELGKESFETNRTVTKDCQITNTVTIAAAIALNGVFFGGLAVICRKTSLDNSGPELPNKISDFLESFTKSIAEMSYRNYLLEMGKKDSEMQQKIIAKNFASQILLANVMTAMFSDDTMKEIGLLVVRYISDYMGLSDALIVINDFKETRNITVCKIGNPTFSENADTESAVKEQLKNHHFNFEVVAREIKKARKNNGYENQVIPIKLSEKWIGFILLSDKSKEKLIFNREYSRVLDSVAMIIVDIHLRKKAENQTVITNEKFIRVLNDINFWIYAIDAETSKIIFVNRSAKRALGHVDITGKKCSDPFGTCINCKECLNKTLIRSGEGASIVRGYYHRWFNRWVMSTTSYVTWLNGRMAILVVAVDLTQEKEKEFIIDKLMWANSVTGLPNRLKLIHHLENNIQNYQTVFLAILNIDYFKRINETYSYEYGNKFILEVSSFLESFNDRDTDLYHIGGDEFAFVVFKQETLDKLLDTVKTRFTLPWTVEGVEHYFTCSFGIACYPTDAVMPEELIKNANRAKSACKERGKNSVIYFNSQEDEKLLQTLRLEHLLANSVSKYIEQFKVFYQPIVDANTGRIIGCEALSRWLQPEMGLVSPVDFIPAAERAGLIGVIDKHVSISACAFTKFLHQQGYTDLTVNVNLSVLNMLDDSLTGFVKELLEITGLDGKYITMEVTESTAMTDVAKAQSIFTNLKEIGIKLALDDFGTGYSSLNSLKMLPIDTLKIDRQFIADLNKSTYNYSFVKTIIELAHSAEMRVCCEGVEENAQWQGLIELRSDLLQGFYFGKPVPEKEFILLLDENRRFFNG